MLLWINYQERAWLRLKLSPTVESWKIMIEKKEKRIGKSYAIL